MKNDKYFLGNFNNYSHQNGWFFGQFMQQGSLLHDNNLEISVKHLPVNWGLQDEHPRHYHPQAKEIGILTKGKVKVKFNDEELVLKAGDFYVLSPGCREQYIQVLEEVELITIKSPSVPDDKILEKK